jgi:hypothetical protein
MKPIIAALAMSLGLAASLPAIADTVGTQYNSNLTSNESQSRNVFDRMVGGE